MAVPHKQLMKAAIRFLQVQPAGLRRQDMPNLVADCQAEMVRRFRLPAQEAYYLALAAWSEIEGRGAGFTFAIELSTPWLVFITDPAADLHRPVPIADMLEYLNAPPAEPARGAKILRLVHDTGAGKPPAA